MRPSRGPDAINDCLALAIERWRTCFTSRHDSSGRMVLESKDVIRRKLGRSPDLADAVALTFADGLFAAGSAGRDPHFNRKLVYPKVGWR